MKVTSWSDVQKILEIQAKEFLMHAYSLELSVPLVVNSRLKSTYGKFVFNRTHKFPVRIEISKNYIEHQEWNTVIETLKHECIHYALFVQDMPFKDGHPVFESELKKWGSHSTGTVKYHGRVVQYGCPSCDTVYTKKRRYPKNRSYVSGCCKKPIVFLGEKVI